MRSRQVEFLRVDLVVQQRLATQILIVGLGLLGRPAASDLQPLLLHARDQAANDAADDVVLNGKDVIRRHVVIVRPDVV
jgi:hypothetical protein